MRIVTGNIIFCDSEVAYKKIQKSQTLPQPHVVFSRSIALLKNRDIESVNIDQFFNETKRKKFKAEIRKTEQKLKIELTENGVDQYLTSIFLQCFNKIQSSILDGLIIDKIICPSQNIHVVEAETGIQEVDEVITMPWKFWLRGVRNFKEITVNVPFHNERSARGATKATFAKKLKVGGVESILWKVGHSPLAQKFDTKRSKLGFIGQSELSKDIYLHCLKSGTVPSIFDDIKNSPVEFKQEKIIAENLISIASEILSEVFSKFENKQFALKARHLMFHSVATEIGLYEAYLKRWMIRLEQHPNLKFLISGYQKGGFGCAMAKACDQMGIKVYACQHGITRELLENASERSVFFENSFCHTLFCFNEEAALATTLSVNAKRTTTEVVNLPKIFERALVSKTPQNDILFISTTLLAGNRPNGVPPTSDYEFYKHDKQIITSILAKCNKHIHYKPYPAIRQIDPDPSLQVVRDLANIELVGSHTDLRYMLDQYRIFITTRATSTVSWPVFSSRPLIFINHYCHSRLSKNAERAFSKAFFLFDQRNKNFVPDLVSFINKPISDIEEMWEKKSAARTETIKRFFGRNNSASAAENLMEAKSSQ